MSKSTPPAEQAPPPNALEGGPPEIPADGRLKRTPFHEFHVERGAKIVPFAGYEMPVQYPTGINAEHRAVRDSCGLFDVSHMGEFVIRGEGAVDFVNRVTTNDVAALEPGQVHYSMILNERGTIEDDCLVYRAGDYVMMVVNASNRAKDLERIGRLVDDFDAEIDDISDSIALLALQGPRAEELLQPLTDVRLDAVGYYRFGIGTIAGVQDVVVSRTGYTGEDGFELYFDADGAEPVWRALTALDGVSPAGLGARDTLRLEAGMCLYGNDIDDTTTPLEAGLAWLVKLGKGEFVGRDALARQKETGVQRKLAGFTVAERAIPRHGHRVYLDGADVGDVRSGTMSPTLGVAIGTAYLPTSRAKEGNDIEIDVRGRRVTARTAKLPFYKRPGS